MTHCEKHRAIPIFISNFNISELYLNLFTLRGGIDDSCNDSLIYDDLRDRNGRLSPGLYRIKEGADLLLPERRSALRLFDDRNGKAGLLTADLLVYSRR